MDCRQSPYCYFCGQCRQSHESGILGNDNQIDWRFFSMHFSPSLKRARGSNWFLACLPSLPHHPAPPDNNTWDLILNWSSTTLAPAYNIHQRYHTVVHCGPLLLTTADDPMISMINHANQWVIEKYGPFSACCTTLITFKPFFCYFYFSLIQHNTPSQSVWRPKKSKKSQ